MKKKILFWIVNFPNSLGESTNALLFAQNLDPNLYEVFFFASERSLAYLESNGKKVLSFVDLQKKSFDLLIFSEYYLFAKLLEENLLYKNLWEKYKKEPIKIATFDTLNFGNEQQTFAKRLDELPFLKNAYPKQLRSEIKFQTIKVCPINKIGLAENGNYYWLLPEIESKNLSTPKINQIIPGFENAKVVIFSLSTWQYLLSNGTEIIFWSLFIDYLTNVFRQIDREIIFIVVSPTETIMSGFFDKVFRKVINIGRERFIHPDFYNQLLISADLFLTVNLIQHSFVRSVISGIPGFSLKSGKVIPKTNFAKEAFTLMSNFSPQNFSSLNLQYSPELEPFKNSLFSKLFESECFSEEERLIESLKKVLFEANYLKNWQKYFYSAQEERKLSPKTGEIIKKILTGIDF